MVFMKFAASFGIVVGDDGTRIDESHVLFPMGNPAQAHGKVWNHGMFTCPVLPDNMWYVYDQAILDKGQIHASWSVDGSDEMEKGWIQKADTLEELAQLIGLDETADRALHEDGRGLQRLLRRRRRQAVRPHPGPRAHRAPRRSTLSSSPPAP